MSWLLQPIHLAGRFRPSVYYEMADRIIADLNDDAIKRRGLTLSGGDPLHPANQTDVLALVKRVRAECPGKDIWMWTGYLLAELSPRQQEIVALIDVLIDGKFEQGLADPSLVWRGSSNQIVHYHDQSKIARNCAAIPLFLQVVLIQKQPVFSYFHCVFQLFLHE